MNNDPDNQNTTQNPVGRFMVAVGGAIELKSTGKLLVIQRSSKLDWKPLHWEIGYGRLDQHEDTEMGLRREVLEETGINDLEICKVLRIWHFYRGSNKAENELIGITYRCRTNTENIHLSNEHVDYKWVSPIEALDMVSEEGIKEDIRRFIND